jgi:hypothetical protein
MPQYRHNILILYASLKERIKQQKVMLIREICNPQRG